MSHRGYDDSMQHGGEPDDEPLMHFGDIPDPEAEARADELNEWLDGYKRERRDDDEPRAPAPEKAEL